MPTVQLSDGRTVEFPDGMTRDAMASALRKLPAPKSSGVINNIGAGINDAIAGTLGLPVDALTGAMNMGARGINAVAGTKLGQINNPVGGSDTFRGLLGLVGADPRNVAANTTGERIARGVGMGIGGALGPGMAARALPAAGGVLGAVQNAVGSGAALGAATASGIAGGAGAAVEEAVPQPYKPLANMGGQLAGAGGAIAAGRGMRGIADGFLGVGNITPERAALARQAIDQYKLPLTGPDLQSGMTPMRWLQSGLDYLPFSGAGGRRQDLQTAVNRAVGNTIGEDTSTITAGTVQRARGGAGQMYDRALTGATVPIDDPLLNRLATSHHEIGQSGLSNNEMGALRGVIDRIQNAAARNDGVLPAEVYQELRKRNSVLDNLMQQGRPTQPYAKEIKAALDDAYQRTNPERAQEFNAANQRWRAIEALRPEVKRGESGNISPLRIQNAANRAYPERDINPASSGSDLGNLGDIAQSFMRRLPESGTAPRSAFMGAMGKLASGAAGPALGAAAGAGVGGVGLLPMLLGGGAVSAGGKAVNSMLNSKTLRDYMIEQAMNPQSRGMGIPGYMLGPIGAPLAAQMRGQQ